MSITRIGHQGVNPLGRGAENISTTPANRPRSSVHLGHPGLPGRGVVQSAPGSVAPRQAGSLGKLRVGAGNLMAVSAGVAKEVIKQEAPKVIIPALTAAIDQLSTRYPSARVNSAAKVATTGLFALQAWMASQAQGAQHP